MTNAINLELGRKQGRFLGIVPIMLGVKAGMHRLLGQMTMETVGLWLCQGQMTIVAVGLWLCLGKMTVVAVGLWLCLNLKRVKKRAFGQRGQ